MEKRKVKASDLLTDIRSEMTDKDLMDKYRISSANLQVFFTKMLEKGVITQDELDRRSKEDKEDDTQKKQTKDKGIASKNIPRPSLGFFARMFSIRHIMNTLWEGLASVKNWIGGLLLGIVIYSATAALGIIMHSSIPIPLAALASIGSLALFLSIITKIRFRFSNISETELIKQKKADESKIQELQKELSDAEQTVVQLKEANRRQNTNLIDYSWILELNLMELTCEHTELLDFCIRNNKKPVTWANRKVKEIDKENEKTWSHRAIGYLKIPYKAKIGVDLTRARFFCKHNEGVIYYWLPEPTITGIREATPSWELQVAMKFVDRYVFKDYWQFIDEETNDELKFWREQSERAVKKVTHAKEVDPHVVSVVVEVAKNRVDSIIQKMFGMKPILVTSLEELHGAMTFQELVNHEGPKALQQSPKKLT